MRKFLTVLFVLALAALAGPVAAGSPPATVTYVHGLMNQTVASESFTLEPGAYYMFECPSYATGCVLVFGNGSDGPEIVWLTASEDLTVDASPLQIEAAMTATAVISPGAVIYYSTHTETWSQGYPTNYRVDLVAQTVNVGAAATAVVPSSIVRRAVPRR